MYSASEDWLNNRLFWVKFSWCMGFGRGSFRTDVTGYIASNKFGRAGIFDSGT